MFEESAKRRMKKTIQSFSHLTMAIIAALLFMFPAAVQTQAGGVTRTVTKTADTNDGVCNADCSLREAIAVSSNFDIIVFTSLFDTPQTITLNLGELVIDNSLQIDGKGARLLTISGNNAGRVFHINGATGTSAHISGLTIAGGSLPVSNNGAGALVEAGNSLNLSSVTIRNNSAYLGGGIYVSGELNVRGSTFTDNTAHSGGAVNINISGVANISNATITRNIANDQGGGIINLGSLTLNNATISHNRAFLQTGVSSAGGVDSAVGTINIRNTIIAANRGGFDDVDGGFTSRGNNLIGNNRGATTNFPAGNPNANGDRVGTNTAPLDALLGELENNGGGTDTRAFLPESPARNNGNNCVVNASCPTNNPWISLTTDQRGSGFPRQRETAVDIGAFELEVASVTNTSDTGAGSLRAAVAASGTGAAIALAIPTNAAGCDFRGVCTINLTSGEILINKSLIITGAGARNVIVQRSSAQGTPSFRIFTVTGNGATLSLFGLTVAGGNPAANGGGIYVDSGNGLNLTEVAVTGNTGSVGGGILNLGDLNITRSTVSHNTATNDSGGLRNNGAALIVNSTFSTNTSLNNGGAIVDFGTLTLVNATVSGNTGNVAGGVFKNSGGALNIRNTIIAANISGNGDFRNDVFGAFTSNGNNLIGNGAGSSGFTNGVNGDKVGTAAAPINPQLGALQNNGGQTDTRALLAGSPALNAGNNCVTIANCTAPNLFVALTTDQRGSGFPRLTGTNVDIGAFEENNCTYTLSIPSTINIDARSDFGSFSIATTAGCAWTAASNAPWIAVTGGASGSGNGNVSFSIQANTTGANRTGTITAGGQLFTVNQAALSLSVLDNSQPEGNSGTTAFLVRFQLSAPWTQTVSVNYATANGTATAGQDYTAKSGTVSFVPGQTIIDIFVDVAGDTIVEPNETFFVNLSNPANAIILDGQGTQTIANDDAVNIVHRAPFDFDGDNKTDVSIFRPGDGSWWYSRSSDNQFRVYSFGVSTDILTPGDYTGDGKTDIAVFRPSTGEWFVQRSEDNSFFSFPFGATGDIPTPADFDGDSKTDAAVFRPTLGLWIILNSASNNTSFVSFGSNGDKPVAADYDGDGKADIAIFRPSDGSWWYLQSSNAQFKVYSFGVGTDKPVQGDYTGDGKADIAIFRPSTGEWFFQRSEDNSYFSVPFGQNGDIAAPGDYDGDGRFDTAVFRPSTGNWFVQRSTAGILITTFGANGDRPVPNAFVP